MIKFFKAVILGCIAVWFVLFTLGLLVKIGVL